MPGDGGASPGHKMAPAGLGRAEPRWRPGAARRWRRRRSGPHGPGPPRAPRKQRETVTAPGWAPRVVRELKGECRYLLGSCQKSHSSLTRKALCRFHLTLRTAEGAMRSEQTLMQLGSAIYRRRGKKIKEKTAAPPGHSSLFPGRFPLHTPEQRRRGGSSRHSRSTDPNHSSLMVVLSTARELQRCHFMFMTKRCND